jgi:hypothetical protein
VVAGLVLFITLGIGACFTLLQWKMPSAESRVHREEALRRGPIPRKEAVRAVVVTVSVYLVLGIAFYVGWQIAGLDAGALSAVVVATIGALVASAWAVRAGWIPRR